jgi:hypothetical protein
VDRQGIAARLRGLLGGQDNGDLGVIAARLGVDEMSLRLSIDDLSPYPTVDVLAAIVSTYGVDPTWLLTGQYSAATHRTAAEEGKREVANSIRTMIRRDTPSRPISSPPELRIVREG